MAGGHVDRNVLSSKFQNYGDTYDDTKTESAMEVLAQQNDDNWDAQAAHKTAAVLDHPDGSVTANKIAPGVIGSQHIDPNFLTQAGLLVTQNEFDKRGVSVDKYRNLVVNGLWTAAIQAAIASVTPTGGEVIFPVGTYNSDTFIVPSNVRLRGFGIKSQIKFVRPTENHFIAVRGQQVVIQDLYLNGNRMGRLTGAADAVTGSTISIATDSPVADNLRTKYVTVKNCVIDTNGFDAVGGWDADHVDILFNEFRSGQDTCVDFVEGCHDINIIGNSIKGGLFPIALDTADTVTYPPVKDVLILGNIIYVDSSTTNGVSVETAQYTSIKENTFHISGGGTAVKVFVDGDYADISNNTFHFNVGSVGSTGIEVNGTTSPSSDKNVNISENIMSSSSRFGVGVNMYYHGGKLTDNVIVGLGTGINIDSGNNSLDFVLRDNKVKNCDVNIRLAGDYVNKSDVHLMRNKTGGGVTYNYSVDNGYKLYYFENPVTAPAYYNSPVERDVKFTTSGAQAASTLGTVAKKMEVFDSQGASLGFVPIYNSIT